MNGRNGKNGTTISCTTMGVASAVVTGTVYREIVFPVNLMSASRYGDDAGDGSEWVGFRVASMPLRGDFNGDGVLDAADINDLTRQSASMLHPPLYDLTGDGLVSARDVEEWVRADDIFYGWMGDANLDGAV